VWSPGGPPGLLVPLARPCNSASVRHVLVLMAVTAIALTAAAAAGEAGSARWLVFETRLSWTRTVTITTQPNDEVECVSTARMTAQSGRFYIAKTQAKRGHFKYGSTPRASAARHTGFSKLKVPGTATLEIGALRCGGGRVDTTCAGTFTARLEIHDFRTATRAEDPRQQRHLNWFHRAPRPPTPPLPQVCMTGLQDRGHGLAALGLLFSAGLMGGVSPRAVPAPIQLMLTKRRFTTREVNPDTQALLPSLPTSAGTVVTTATFVRVR
jgi:hypothetical protein